MNPPENLALSEHRNFGVAIGDVDEDGDIDAFVANSLGPSKVWTSAEVKGHSEGKVRLFGSEQPMPGIGRSAMAQRPRVPK